MDTVLAGGCHTEPLRRGFTVRKHHRHPGRRRSSPMATQPVTVVAADHPSLDGAVQAFVDALEPTTCPPGGEGHRRRAAHWDAGRAGDGFRVAAIEDTRIVGLAQVDAAGVLDVVVASDRRDLGIGTALVGQVVARARQSGYDRLVLPGSRRSRRVVEFARQHRSVLVRHRDRRLELVLHLSPLGRTG